jgi:hypothetical protein
LEGEVLFSLVRVHVPLSVYDSKHRVEKRVADHVWNYIAENHQKWRTKDVKLLYMTHRHMQEDTSLIVCARSSDALADYLMKHIAPIEDVRGIWVLNMAKMKFFKTPKGYTGDFQRFTVTIDAVPHRMQSIFESIASLKPGRDIIINYIAHTFQSFNASIMVSVLARSYNHMEAFVNDYIRPLEGVENAEITRISRTMRLVSPDEWRRSLSRFFVASDGESIKDIDAEDDSLIAGC